MSFSSHKAVISAFGQYYAKTGELPQEFHKLLLKAFEKRQMGDYLSETSFTFDEVAELMRQVEAFIKSARNWLGL